MWVCQWSERSPCQSDRLRNRLILFASGILMTRNPPAVDTFPSARAIGRVPANPFPRETGNRPGLRRLERALALTSEGTVGCVHERSSHVRRPRSSARDNAAFGFGEGVAGRTDRGTARKPYSGWKGVALFSRNRDRAAHHRPPR